MNERMKSRNTAIAILSTLLVAACIAGIILYREHLRDNDALQDTEKKLLDLNEKLIPSKNALIADLQNKLKMTQSSVFNLEGRNAKVEANLRQLQNKYEAVFSKLEELKNANERMSELDRIVSVKNQSISRLDEKINKLKKDMEEQQHVQQSLRSDLSFKDQMLTNLQNAHTTDIAELKNARGKISELKSMVNGKDERISQLQEKILNLEHEFEINISRKQSHILYLKEEITNGKRENERLHLQLSDLKGKKGISDSEMARLKSTYEKLVGDLHTQLKNHEVAIKTYKEKISVTFVDRILFDSGKATISAEGRKMLRKVGETIKEVQNRQIRIIGHTDDIPIMQEYSYKFPTNWELSSARAAAVVRYFQKEIGLDPENIEAVGRSFYQPIASNETPQGRAQNRRVNIIIGPKMR